MALPGQYVSKPRDGGINLSAGSGTDVAAIIGLATAGHTGIVQSFVDPDDVRAEYGRGPLPDALCDALLNGAKSILGVRMATSHAGSITAGDKFAATLVTKVEPGDDNSGSGSMAVSGDPVGNAFIEVELLSGGAVGEATFQWRMNGGAWSDATTTGSASAANATGMVLRFVDGQTPSESFVTGDTFEFTTIVDSVGIVSFDQTSNPLVDGNLEINIVTGGGLNEAVFVARLGVTVLEARVVQESVELDEFGVTVTFNENGGSSLAFVAGDSHILELEARTPGISDAIAAIDLFKSYRPRVHWLYVARRADETAWAILEAKAEEFRLANVEMFFLVDAKGTIEFDDTTAWTADLLSDAAATTCIRVGAIAAEAVFADYDSPGIEVSRSIGGCLTGRLLSLKCNQHPGRVIDGPLVGPIRRYPHDDANNCKVTDGHLDQLDTAGFITCREFDGFGKGVFVTNFRMLAPVGSDYQWGEYRRTMDEACRAVRLRGQRYANFDGDAEGLAAYAGVLNGAITDMINAKKIAGGQITIPPGQNIAATSTVRSRIGIRPIGVMRYLWTEIGFIAGEED